jgi:predicted enzyme related to lactoylglutathione lyase
VEILAVTGPDFLAIQVRDLEASARFYADRRGLARASGSPPGAVVFATEPIPFAVREPAVDLGAASRLGWGVALWLKADDVDRLHEDLASHGVTIVTAPFDGPFGRTFAFADPDGYVITLHG